MKPLFAILLSLFLVGFAREDCVCCFSVDAGTAGELPVSSGCCGEDESPDNAVPPLGDCCSSGQCALSDCGELTFASLDNEAVVDLRTLVVAEPQMGKSKISVRDYAKPCAARAPPDGKVGPSQSLPILYCVHRL